MVATIEKSEGVHLVFMLHSDSRTIHVNHVGDERYHEAHAFSLYDEARLAFWRLAENSERGVYHW